MTKPEVVCIGANERYLIYKCFNDIDEDIRGFEKPLKQNEIEQWQKDFNKRYFRNKYIIVASALDDFEFIVGVWNNLEEMSKSTGFKKPSIASVITRRNKGVHIKVNGITCKLELVNVYERSNKKCQE